MLVRLLVSLPLYVMHHVALGLICYPSLSKGFSYYDNRIVMTTTQCLTYERLRPAGLCARTTVFCLRTSSYRSASSQSTVRTWVSFLFVDTWWLIIRWAVPDSSIIGHSAFIPVRILWEWVSFSQVSQAVESQFTLVTMGDQQFDLWSVFETQACGRPCLACEWRKRH